MARFFHTEMLQQLKTWMLPIAMLVGALFYDFFASLAFLTPYLIFLMLLAPYSKLTLHRIRMPRFYLSLLAVQVFGSLAVYGLICLIDPIIAQGVFICILVPTATSAAVITGMLGGSISTLATYCLLSNFTVALISPLIFSWIGEHVSMPFFQSFGIICRQMFPLLILPFLLVLALKRFTPHLHERLRQSQQISFYLWALSLTIVMGRTVAFLVHQQAANYNREAYIALGSLVVCILQFLIGRRIGSHFANRIAGAQGLGQKNTVLAIWMAQTYLNPITSVGAASYVVWQNTINSWQLWYKRHKDQQTLHRHHTRETAA